MVKYVSILLLAVTALSGCSTVITYDPENDERERFGRGEIVSTPTPDHVVVGEKDGITIDVRQAATTHDEQLNVDLQVWNVNALNVTDTDRCVTPVWKLMDFEYISRGPSEQLVRAYSTKRIGWMQQQTWVIDGVVVAPPPSGYLADLRIRNPVEGAKEGEECVHLVNETDIEEQ